MISQLFKIDLEPSLEMTQLQWGLNPHFPGLATPLASIPGMWQSGAPEFGK